MMKFIFAFFSRLVKFSAPEFIVHEDLWLNYFQAVELCESAETQLALFDDQAEFLNVSIENIYYQEAFLVP